MPFAANGIAPPLPLSKASALPNLPKTFFSLCRQAKLHAEGASLSACGKHHSPKANITVQLLWAVAPWGTAKRWMRCATAKEATEANNWVYLPIQKQLSHFAVGRNFTPQAFNLPTAANFTRRRRIAPRNCRGQLPLCLPPGGRGTAKRWKEPAGMKATICLL